MAERQRHRVWPSPQRQRVCCRCCDGEGRPWRSNSPNPDESKTSEAGQLWRWSSLPFPSRGSLLRLRLRLRLLSSPTGLLSNQDAVPHVSHLARWDDLAFLCGAPSRHARAESEWRRAMWPPPSLLPSLLSPPTLHMALVQSEGSATCGLYMAKSMWVFFGLFFMPSNYYQSYLHNKTFIALASL